MRVDTGVRQGDTVTPFYDPMIAKVIVHDRDRTSAMRRMAALMGETEVVGVTTNAALLKALCSHPAFVGGEVDTGFIERHHDTLFAKPAPADDRVLAAATLARLLEFEPSATLERSVGPEERLPAARGGPRRGALEGRRARGGRDRPPPARRRHRPGAAGRRRSRRACERREDGRLAIRLGSDTFTATVVRARPMADGIDYVVFADGSSRAPAAGRSARRHAVRGGGLGRGRGERAAARQDHRPAREGRRQGEQGPAAAGAGSHEDGAHARRTGGRYGQDRTLCGRRAGAPRAPNWWSSRPADRSRAGRTRGTPWASSSSNRTFVSRSGWPRRRATSAPRDSTTSSVS